MPLNKEAQARLELLVNIDNTTYNRAKTQLRSLSKSSANLQIDEGSLKEFAAQIREAVRHGSDSLDTALYDRFDMAVGDALTKFASLQQEILTATAAGDEGAVQSLMDRRERLQEEIKAESEAHKRRLEAAQKLREATELNPKNLTEAGEAIGHSFSDVFSKMRAGDFSGLVESLAGAAGKALSKKAEVTSLAGEAAPDADVAASLAAQAASLTKVAGVLALIGSAVVSVVAVLMMAEEQAHDLNKTLLEGASIADFAAKSQIGLLVDMTSTLDAARAASNDMAFEFRGTTEEMAEVLSHLVQAGLSYEELAAGARHAKNETEAYSEAIRTTFKWSSALGLSVSEIADATAEWSTDFGKDLTVISENFATISKYAMQGGFNVKRFFSAVSQATAGMAIYNIRMEEAAYLLSKTQKILGGTDASEFIRSLTQGFTDESMTDRMKRIMIAGGKDTATIFAGTAERTAASFVKTFSGSSTRDALSKAFQHVEGFNVDVLQDPKKLADVWGKLSGQDRRLVVGALRENGDEQAQAAARQLETLGRVLDGAEGGFDAQVRGLAALDMQGKLSYKLQTLGDKRLNDMTAVELAAFENYAGISGSQLEQLMRVESQLMADYELAKAQGVTTAASFDEWVATNEAAQEQLEGIQEIEDSAEYFTRKSVENTRSVFTILKNTIAMILNNIYTTLTDWFGWSKQLSSEDMTKQGEAVSEIRLQREEATRRLEEIDARLGELDATIATTGASTEEHAAALQEKDALEAEQRSKGLAKDYLRAQESKVLLMDSEQFGALKDGDAVLAEAAKQLRETGQDLDLAAKNLSPEELKALQEGIAGSDKTHEVLTTNYGRMSPAGPGEYKAPMAQVVKDGDATTAAQIGLLQEAMDDSLALDATSASDLLLLSDLSEDALALERKKADRDLKWQLSGFQKKSEVAGLDALKAYEGWRLGTYAGLEGADLSAAMSEWASGETTMGQGKLAEALSAKGLDVLAYQQRALGMGDVGGVVAPDFVMRPGQPAQRFHPSDTILGVKAGGPLAGNAGGGTVNITINGGDQAGVYRTVKDALKNSGLRP